MRTIGSVFLPHRGVTKGGVGANHMIIEIFFLKMDKNEIAWKSHKQAFAEFLNLGVGC